MEKKRARIGYCLCEPYTFLILYVRSPVFVLFYEYILENVEKNFTVRYTPFFGLTKTLEENNTGQYNLAWRDVNEILLMTNRFDI